MGEGGQQSPTILRTSYVHAPMEVGGVLGLGRWDRYVPRPSIEQSITDIEQEGGRRGGSRRSTRRAIILT